MEKVLEFFRVHSIRILRYSMGLIYFWYGLLKIWGISPAEEIVLRSTHWLSVHNFVIFLGVWEVIIGLCFFWRRLLPIGLILFFLHAPGTFLPLFLVPEDCFTFIPFGLTLEGQYIIKNLVYVAAALVLVGHLRPSK